MGSEVFETLNYLNFYCSPVVMLYCWHHSCCNTMVRSQREIKPSTNILSNPLFRQNIGTRMPSISGTQTAIRLLLKQFSEPYQRVGSVDNSNFIRTRRILLPHFTAISDSKQQLYMLYNCPSINTLKMRHLLPSTKTNQCLLPTSQQ